MNYNLLAFKTYFIAKYQRTRFKTQINIVAPKKCDEFN